MTDSEPLDLDLLRAYARAALEQARFAGGNAAVANLAASVLTLAAKLEQAWAENAAHVLDMALLSAALDPLQTMAEHD